MKEIDETKASARDKKGKDGPDGPDEAGKPRSSLVMLLLLVMNLGGTGFVAFEVLTMPVPAAAASEAAVEVAGDAGVEEEPEAPGPIRTMAPFVVNLNDPENPRFLRVTVDLEVRDGDVMKELGDESTMLRIVRDELMRYLSSLTIDDIMGEDNKVAIKEEMIARLSEHLGEGEVRRVLFSEFVVQ